VLRNLLGITSVRELEHKESEELLAATHRTIDERALDRRFPSRWTSLTGRRFGQNVDPCLETDKGLYLVRPLIAGSQSAIFNANQAD
jgi:hypothetical protein